MAKRIQVKAGDRYGRLTVIEEVAPARHPGGTCRKVLCKCECGNEITARLSSLRVGATKSCGCLSRRLLAHKGTTLCMAEWSRRIGMSAQSLDARLNRCGYTVEEALTLPLGVRRSQ